jgi:predicted RNA-binding protein YlxR (DUF448 family)
MALIDATNDRETGRKRNDDEPLRRCIVSNQRLPSSQMVRFVIGPDNMVVPDLVGRLPGRGIWLSADRNIIKTACARSLFAYAARQQVQANDELAEQVETLLVRRCTELLGLARRAGEAVAGFVKVQGWLRKQQVAVLLAASDGSMDGRGKLRRGARGLPEVDILCAAEIGVAFGREESVHAALSSGGLADKFVETAARLSGFRCVPEHRKSDE